MTISEFIKANPERISNWSDDDHIIQVRKNDGTLDLVCFADMDRPWTQQRMEQLQPGFLQWEVVNDEMTLDEITQLVKQSK